MVFDLAQLKTAEVQPDEPMMRLLKCMKCRSIEEVPGYDGPEGGEGTAEFDQTLKFFTDVHVNGKCNREDLVMYALPVRFWIIPKVKESIEQQLKDGAQGLDIFGTNYYTTNNNNYKLHPTLNYLHQNIYTSPYIYIYIYTAIAIANNNQGASLIAILFIEISYILIPLQN